MSKAIKLAVILLATGLTVGCATKGDLDERDAKLNASISSVKSTADEALAAAQAAEAKAASAESAARRAAAAAEEANSKLDRLFKKTMQK